MLKIIHKKKGSGESGQALILVLVLLTLASLFIPPLLNFIGTGAKTGLVYDKKTAELYAADAGIQDATWQLRSKNIETIAGFSRYDYGTTGWSYSIPPVNDEPVSVTIHNLWIPSNITPAPSESTARGIITTGKLIVLGNTIIPGVTADDGSTIFQYQIKIAYTPIAGENLTIDSIGIWLPPGFTYFSDANHTCSLTALNGDYTSTMEDVDGTPWVGNKTWVWNFDSKPLYNYFPGISGTTTKTITVSLYFIPPQDQPTLKPDAISWIKTGNGTDYGIPYSWDAGTTVYKVTSIANKPGDVGTTVDSLIAHSELPQLQTAQAGDYFAIGNSLIGGNGHYPDNYHYQLYNSSQAAINTSSDPISGIPDNATIEAAYLYWTGWEDWHGYEPDPILADDCSNFNSPPVTWTEESHWSINTGMFRGRGGYASSNNLTSNTIPLGDYSGQSITLSLAISDSNAEEGDYLYYQFYNSSGWSGQQFIFVGNYSSGTYSVTIPDGYLTPAFRMRFTVDFTSTNEYVYLDDITIVPCGLKYPVDPSAENIADLVENKARVNKVLFNDTLVTANTYQVLYPDQFDGTNFEDTWFYTAMADVKPLLDQWVEDGLIESNGAGSYTLGHYYVGIDPSADNYRVNSADTSYSFTFFDGGSTGYPLGTPSPSSNPSNSRYTAAHAGWSLLIIYSSPETLGHQLYLYDIKNPNFNFFFGWQNNADFDNDGNPGGTIGGFVVPIKIAGETLSGRITVFVGEGDAGYTQDYFRVNNINMWNSQSPPDNVWNGDSPGLTVPGVDIDTFDITWSSNILKTGDTYVVIDIPTGTVSPNTDGFSMVYMILSFRSKITTGGSLGYLIR